jgi:hypothetical protein
MKTYKRAAFVFKIGNSAILNSRFKGCFDRCEMIKHTIKNYCKGVTVEVNSGMEWMAITEEGCEQSVFLQHKEARDFIREARVLYKTSLFITLEECYIFLAQDFTILIEY